MTLWQEYRQPTSIPKAIEDLSSAPEPVIPIAGGTDLLLDLRQGRHEPVHTLVDLTGIAELKVIEYRDGSLFIGACVPINRIVADPLVLENAQALHEACDLIAGPQVRNTATLGGNVAHALPAADGMIALLALGATIEIAGLEGKKQMPFLDLFLGPGKSALNKSEIITGFLIPVNRTGQASAFKRIMRPQGVALPILNCAVWVDQVDEYIRDIRISVGPGGPTPFRGTEAEDIMRGQKPDSGLLSQGYNSLLEQGHFRTSKHRATSDYRKHILFGLFRDTFMQAWSRSSD